MSTSEIKQAILAHLEYSLDEISLDGFDNFTEISAGVIHVAADGDFYFRVRLEPATADEYGKPETVDELGKAATEMERQQLAAKAWDALISDVRKGGFPTLRAAMLDWIEAHKADLKEEIAGLALMPVYITLADQWSPEELERIRNSPMPPVELRRLPSADA